LGATTRHVAGLVAREGAVLTVCGALLGIAGALAVGRLLATLLYGVADADPFTFVVVAGALGTAAVVAVVHPAWRAARVDPALVLRAD
jgi:ABC-type antimicrobial peptide transport system permease subunit